MAIWFQTTAGESYNITIKPMLQIGLTAYNFEPFKRQSFDFNLGYQLFNKNNFQTIKAYFTTNNPTLQSNNDCLTAYIRCEPNTTYTITKVSSSRFGVGYLTTLPAIGGTVRGVMGGVSTETTYTITTDSAAKYLVIWYYFMSNDTNISSDYLASTIQVVKGSQALPYAPYFEPIELFKIGDYQDYLYNIGGKWYKHQEVGEKVLTGNEADWAAFSVNYEYQLPFETKASFDIEGTFITGLYSSHFKNTSQASTDMSNYAFTFFASAGYRWFRFRYNEKTSLADFKTWLASNNVTIYYPLKASQELEITDLNALTYLNNIKYGAESYYGTTNITITSTELQPTMKVQTLNKIGG